MNRFAYCYNSCLLPRLLLTQLSISVAHQQLWHRSGLPFLTVVEQHILHCSLPMQRRTWEVWWRQWLGSPGHDAMFAQFEGKHEAEDNHEPHVQYLRLCRSVVNVYAFAVPALLHLQWLLPGLSDLMKLISFFWTYALTEDVASSHKLCFPLCTYLHNYFSIYNPKCCMAKKPYKYFWLIFSLDVRVVSIM